MWTFGSSPRGSLPRRRSTPAHCIRQIDHVSRSSPCPRWRVIPDRPSIPAPSKEPVARVQGRTETCQSLLISALSNAASVGAFSKLSMNTPIPSNV